MPDRQNQTVSITELERAINYWRQLNPSSRDTMTLCSQASSLAEFYAHMILLQMNQMQWSEFSDKAKKAFEDAEAAFEKGQNQAA